MVSPPSYLGPRVEVSRQISVANISDNTSDNFADFMMSGTADHPGLGL